MGEFIPLLFLQNGVRRNEYQCFRLFQRKLLFYPKSALNRLVHRFGSVLNLKFSSSGTTDGLNRTQRPKCGTGCHLHDEKQPVDNIHALGVARGSGSPHPGLPPSEEPCACRNPRGGPDFRLRERRRSASLNNRSA